MKFVKMHGLGNDYIFADCIKGGRNSGNSGNSKDSEEIEAFIQKAPEVAIKVSNRHFGVGADGLILICQSEKADYMMRIYNADGSEAEMCGNGIRCVGKYLYDNGYVKYTSVSIETKGGIKLLKLLTKDGLCTGAIVDMGAPILTPQKIPVLWNDDRMVDCEIIIGGKPYSVTAVSMGNPHAIVFVKDVQSMKIDGLGALIENNYMFPARTNVEFVTVIDRNTLRMRVWERGSGETLACGTGASASVVAAVLNGYCDRNVTVRLNGGELKITWDEKTGHIFMQGPAETICTISTIGGI